MKPKVGKSFWSVSVLEGKVDVDEWVVTSVRRVCVSKGFGRVKPLYQNTAYVKRKNKDTWVKKSKKHSDYGWANNVSRINRSVIRYDDDWVFDRAWRPLFTTRLQALQYCERQEAINAKKDFEDFEFDDEVYTAAEQERDAKRDLAAIRRAITLERKRSVVHKKTRPTLSFVGSSQAKKDGYRRSDSKSSGEKKDGYRHET